MRELGHWEHCQIKIDNAYEHDLWNRVESNLYVAIVNCHLGYTLGGTAHRDDTLG